jgi:hypothetical protein
MAIPRGELSRVEVRVGAPSRAGRGALIGMAAGAVAGKVLADLCRDMECAERPNLAIVEGAALGALIGVNLGAGNTAQWEPADLPRSAARPRGRRACAFTLALSLPAP